MHVTDQQQTSHSQSTSLGYLASVSHDLKSPLNAILGFAQLIRYDLDSGSPVETIHENLDIIEKVGQEMLDLIHNMLTASRINAGKEEMQPFTITRSELEIRAHDLHQTFTAEALSRNIDFQVVVRRLPDFVHWDMLKVRYFAINNLISNALKFVGDKGSVRVEIDTSESNEVSIAVLDNGPGIPLDERQEIFDIYGQAASNRSAHLGTGFGLYNALHVVQEHRGNIEVTAGIEGKGVGFVIKIPALPFPFQLDGVEQFVVGNPGRASSQNVLCS